MSTRQKKRAIKTKQNKNKPHTSLVLENFLAKHHPELYGIFYALGLFWDVSQQNLIELHQGQWISISLNQMRFYSFLFVRM